MTTFKGKLIEADACEEAIEWVGSRSEKRAWHECHRGDWMLWYGWKKGILSDKNLILLAADFAERVLPIFEKVYPEDQRPREAIRAARDFAHGKILWTELNEASAAARVEGAAWAAESAAKAAESTEFKWQADRIREYQPCLREDSKAKND